MKFDFSFTDPNLVSDATALLKEELLLDHKTRLSIISKALDLPQEADAEHEYSHRSGQYGDYDYFYSDPRGNYWKYTNAPGDHMHHDPKSGIPMISPDQPMPHTAPEYFTADGMKRSVAVPPGVEPERNPNYNPVDPKNKWYEIYADPQSGGKRYTYLDRDTKIDPSLYIQHNIRLVDAGILKYRKFAQFSFQNSHPRDRNLGILLMLADQAFFHVESLLNATVQDLQFVGKTVILQGRKFDCDSTFFMSLVSLRAGRNPEEPLFVVNTSHGSRPLGPFYVSAVFRNLKMSPTMLLYWHATQMYSTIVHRMVATGEVEDGDIDAAAMKELSNYLHTEDTVGHLVDSKVRETLQKQLQNPEASMVKSISHAVAGDSYGCPYVDSSLAYRTEDEMAFSQWLHNEPMHDDAFEEGAEQSPEEDVQKSTLFILTKDAVPQHGADFFKSCTEIHSDFKVSSLLAFLTKSTPVYMSKHLAENPSLLNESFEKKRDRVLSYFDLTMSKSQPGEKLCFVVDAEVGLILQGRALYSTQTLVEPLAKSLTLSNGSCSTFEYNHGTKSYKAVSVNTNKAG